jgi:hypothetical protein
MSRDSSVTTATGYGLDDRGSIHGKGNRFCSTSQRPERLSGSPKFLHKEQSGSFPWRLSSRGVKLTTHLPLVPRSTMVELYFRFPICLHGVVLNCWRRRRFFILFFVNCVCLCEFQLIPQELQEREEGRGWSLPQMECREPGGFIWYFNKCSIGIRIRVNISCKGSTYIQEL